MTPFPRRLRALALLLGLAGAFGAARAQSPEPPPAPRPFNPKLPTIFLAGDSTAAHLPAPRCGWGVPFPAFFDASKVNVVDDARGGRSSRTFITEGLWGQLLSQVKPGDVVLIQFGHNDAGAVNAPPPGSHEPLRARGSLPGLGDQTEAIDNVLTHRHEVVHTFGWYMRRMVEEARDAGATPIVLGITVRDIWHGGKVERGMGKYTPWSAAVARQEGAPFVDLTTITADRYEAMGQPAVKKLFPLDHTHTNLAGAWINARGVVAGLKALPNSPVDGWLSTRGQAVPAAPATDVAR
jgi:lysophospholipase L1-like esterase